MKNMYKKIYLKKGKEESLKRFHPWVFSGAIQHQPEDVDEGEVVRVTPADNRCPTAGRVALIASPALAKGATAWPFTVQPMKC